MKRRLKKSHVDSFEEYLILEEKSKATVDKYLRDVRCFLNYAQDNVVNKELMLTYKEQLEKTYSLSSANSMLAATNAFLKFMSWSDCCVKQFKVQRKTYCSEEMELSKEEYQRLIRAAEQRENKRLALLIQTICATGIRVSELQYITMEAVRKGEVVVTCKGKTRTIFIVTALQKKLLTYAKERQIKAGVLFITKKGKPMNRSNIWREMKGLCERAGVSPNKVFPHNLRHLFARTFYGIEKDIVKLADILGHSRIDTTRIYIMTTGIEHRRKMERLQLII